MNDAISCSLPVIANDKIGVKERFSRGNALLYRQGNINDLVKKIQILYKDPVQRKKMGNNGRELVVEKMSWLQKAMEYIA
jgi:glycosyltransferase involved in cell wall biosynthesis